MVSSFYVMVCKHKNSGLSRTYVEEGREILKVGDLVMLSAYGRKLKNYYVGRENDVGIVISVRWCDSYVVIWASDGSKTLNMDRRDIMYAKIKE